MASQIERGAKLEGRNMTMIVAPKTQKVIEERQKAILREEILNAED
jgi:hypothetical protein